MCPDQATIKPQRAAKTGQRHKFSGRLKHLKLRKNASRQFPAHPTPHLFLAKGQESTMPYLAAKYGATCNRQSSGPNFGSRVESCKLEIPIQLGPFPDNSEYLNQGWFEMSKIPQGITQKVWVKVSDPKPQIIPSSQVPEGLRLRYPPKSSKSNG